MAFTDKSPSAWLGFGYAANTGKIEFNTNNAASYKLLQELTDTEADETTGDIRKLMFGLIDGVHKALQAKLESLALADRPANFTINKASAVNSDGSISASYTLGFRLAAPSTLEVADEPSV